MEELWKSYTRPAILKGAYPFSLPSDRPVYLTSVRDMGRLAAACILAEGGAAAAPSGRVNVASDVLTPLEMSAAFAQAQGSPCRHKKNRFFFYLSRFLLPDLYEVVRFYRTSTETTDVAALGASFPQVQLTPFATFLQETAWGDAEKTYEDLISVGTF